MNAKILLLLPLALSAFVVAADKRTIDDDDGETKELRIGLSPGAIRRAELESKLTLYRKSVAGDTESKDGWGKLDSSTQLNVLAEMAITREASDARTQSIKDIARLKSNDDPKALGLLALIRVALAEGDGGMRDLARKALAVRNDDRAPVFLARALRSDDALVRGNVAAAMKAIGGPRIFEVIIEHWKETWGAGPRTHAFFGTQRSYVGDYDISGDSYDPVIRTFITGTVLDSKVLRVEGDIYYVTIREITPFAADNLPNNPVAWEKWVQEQRAKLIKEAEKNRTLAANSLNGSDDE